MQTIWLDGWNRFSLTRSSTLVMLPWERGLSACSSSQYGEFSSIWWHALGNSAHLRSILEGRDHFSLVDVSCTRSAVLIFKHPFV